MNVVKRETADVTSPIFLEGSLCGSKWFAVNSSYGESGGRAHCSLLNKVNNCVLTDFLCVVLQKLLININTSAMYLTAIESFHIIINQNVNRHLKVIREICEIDISISFHIGTHTFRKKQ
jgi:hypothetical protein